MTRDRLAWLDIHKYRYRICFVLGTITQTLVYSPGSESIAQFTYYLMYRNNRIMMTVSYCTLAGSLLDEFHNWWLDL
jgi:hypothetical protein